MRGLEDITEEDFDHAVAVNLKSAFLCTQAVLPGMRARTLGPDRQYLLDWSPRRRRLGQRRLRRRQGRT
jgi:NAD(P)-dependent dehydrogenase (short-subunit alcohol dehydrogenase family)